MIALYGLTGDMPHNGHVRVVSSICDLSYINKVYIHVSYAPKYKKPIASFADRLSMCVMALSFPKVEFIRDRLKYTSTVVEYIKKRETDHIRFFTGEDWDVSTFHNAKYVKNNVQHVIVNDTNIELHKAFSDRPRLLIRNPIPVHSSDLRSMIKEGASLYGLVPDDVINFIKHKGLYGYK